MRLPNLLREELSLPAAVLHEARLAHNLDWMRRFVAAYRVELCPHGKTTMAPKLFHRQLAAGAWGITLATASQARVAHRHGIKRIVMANQLVGRANMAMVSGLLRDPDFEFFCLVDSAASVDALGAFFAPLGQRIDVLLEIGVEGGRSGVRHTDQEAETLVALDRWRGTVFLRGVELFEGILTEETAVRAFLGRAVDAARRLIAGGWLTDPSFLLSGAGSAWFDVVAEAFTTARFDIPATVVLRPGCYLTHDVGLYREPAARMREENAVVRELGIGLRSALQVWAYVLSVPESELAIVGLGKRDASFDAGFPTPTLRFRPGEASPTAAPASWTIERMMDQHATVRIGEGDDLQVGDMLGFDVSHPCLTFDRWRHLPILNERFDVVDVVETFFRPD